MVGEFAGQPIRHVFTRAINLPPINKQILCRSLYHLLCFTDQATFIVSGSGIVILFLSYLRVSRETMSGKEEKGGAQDAAERIKAATLSAAKGLNRSQAELAAAAAAQNVNAYGQKEEGPSRWQERKEAK